MKREKYILLAFCILGYGISITFWNWKNIKDDKSISKYYIEWANNKYINPNLYINFLYRYGIQIKFLRGRE